DLPVYRLPGGELIRSVLASGGAGSLVRIAISADGAKVATSNAAVTDLWYFASGKRVQSYAGSATALAFSATNNQLLGAFGSVIHRIDAVTGQELEHLCGHSSPVWVLRIREEGGEFWTGD